LEYSKGDIESHTAFFPGCALHVLAPELSRKVFDWLQEKRYATQQVLKCCGMPQFYEKSVGAFSKQVDSVFEVFARQRIDRVVVACPNCYRCLSDESAKTERQVEVVALSSLLVQEGVIVDPRSLPVDSIVTIHDACPDREEQRFAEDLRSLARELAVVEMKHSGRKTMCCGIGGPFYGESWEVKERQIDRRRNEAFDVRATHIISPCVNCAVALGKGAGSLTSTHYLELIFGEWIDRDAQVHISNALG